MEIGKKYTVVKPILLGGKLSTQDDSDDSGSYVSIYPGDVVTVVTGVDFEGYVVANRDSDGLDQYISAESLKEIVEEPGADFDTFEDIPELRLVRNERLYILKTSHDKVVVNSRNNPFSSGWVKVSIAGLGGGATEGPYFAVNGV